MKKPLHEDSLEDDALALSFILVKTGDRKLSRIVKVSFKQKSRRLDIISLLCKLLNQACLHLNIKISKPYWFSVNSFWSHHVYIYIYNLPVKTF